MPRHASQVVEIDGDCHLEPEQVLEVMCDLQLYSRFPMLSVFRSKMIRLQARARQLTRERVRDSRLRKLYHDAIDEFLGFLWELQKARNVPTGFRAFMRERHRLAARRFVCQARAGPVVLT